MIIKVNLKNIPKQGLSTREASRILKITPTTLYHRLKKLRETGGESPWSRQITNRHPAVFL